MVTLRGKRCKPFRLLDSSDLRLLDRNRERRYNCLVSSLISSLIVQMGQNSQIAGNPLEILLPNRLWRHTGGQVNSLGYGKNAEYWAIRS